jgi:hypothetical protein
MEKLNQFSLMVDALTELVEEKQARQTPLMAGPPTLSSVLANMSPLPHNALFLGLAEDGLPLLLNLYDPIPGPILIAGDQACGKTDLLQMIASAVELLHAPSDVQSGIITQHPEEWESYRNSKSTAGIYNIEDDNSLELLQSLVTWAHNNKGEGQSILLLIDGLEAVSKLDQPALQNLRWLLLRGPSRRVWPIVTVNASNVRHLEAWLDFFHTRLFGHIQDPEDSAFITGDPTTAFDDLTAGSQFAMREGDKWLKFLAPAINQS